MSLWGGRFNQEINKDFKLFNDSLRIDYKLVEHDIIGSIAWSRILITVNVLNQKEQKQIESALRSILDEVRNSPKIILNSDAEDVHSWVEYNLIKKIGCLGKKLHTGRSRNDQVTTDLKLWCKTKIIELFYAIHKFQKIIIKIAESNQDVIMPGYTHLQRAQPIPFSHWCLAYNEMLSRDESRLQDTLVRMDICPLGSGALAGTSYSIDRDKLASWLGFSSATNNSLDSVSDRDYILELLSNSSIGMVHLSRFAEDLIFFNTGEANFIELNDNITSGSSLMPQKKNPDSLELIRGKCGRVHGALISMMIVLKGLPMSYNKDMQEDKEIIFDTLTTWINCLQMSSKIISNIKLNKSRCYKAAQKGYANSTELADYLVNKGIPFREAHHIVGSIIIEAIKQDKSLEELSLKSLQSFNSKINDDVYRILSISSCLKKRNSKGGVSSEQISLAIYNAKKKLKDQKDKIYKKYKF